MRPGCRAIGGTPVGEVVVGRRGSMWCLQPLGRWTRSCALVEVRACARRRGEHVACTSRWPPRDTRRVSCPPPHVGSGRPVARPPSAVRCLSTASSSGTVPTASSDTRSWSSDNNSSSTAAGGSGSGGGVVVEASSSGSSSTAGRTAALTEAEFAAIMNHAQLGTLPPGSKIAIAVSGGPDSMALCRLLHRWARGRNVDVLALTVDHGLRPESRQEAERVHAWLTSVGMHHEILHQSWDKPKQKSKVQEAARAYRYALLYERCKKEGITNLLTAHQLEDQVETFLLRLAHRSGVDGLAGIQMRHPRFFPMQVPSVEHKTVLSSTRIAPSICPPLASAPLKKPHMDSYPPPLFLVRPLLGVPKERLMATCEAFGQASVDDPTNMDPAYHRNRIRKALPMLWETVGRDDLMRTIHHFQNARVEMNKRVAELLSDKRVLFSPARPGLALRSSFTDAASSLSKRGRPLRAEDAPFAGHLYVPISFFLEEDASRDPSKSGVPQPVSMRILQSCLQTVGGLKAERLLFKLQSLREVADGMRATATHIIRNRVPSRTLHRLPSAVKTSFTCCGCLIELISPYGILREPFFLIVPERGLQQERELIRPNETLLWENRLALSLSTKGAASAAEQFYVRRVVPSDYRNNHLSALSRDIPGVVRIASPAITDEQDRVVALPTWNYSARSDLSFAFTAVFPLVPSSRSSVLPQVTPTPAQQVSLAGQFDLLIDRLKSFSPTQANSE